MGYLLPTEYESYGLAAETTDDWVATASALMEAHCRRPTLLPNTYTERLRVTGGCHTVRVSYLPLAAVAPASSAVVSLRGRLGQQRRGEALGSFWAQVVRTFSAPGSWTVLDVSTIDVNVQTGELTLPVNLLGFSYNEVEVTYTAGVAAIPPALKVACAQIVRNAQATPALNVRSSQVDTLHMQYFSGSLLDEQVLALLRPYVAQRLG